MRVQEPWKCRGCCESARAVEVGGCCGSARAMELLHQVKEKVQGEYIGLARKKVKVRLGGSKARTHLLKILFMMVMLYNTGVSLMDY